MLSTSRSGLPFSLMPSQACSFRESSTGVDIIEKVVRAMTEVLVVPRPPSTASLLPKPRQWALVVPMACSRVSARTNQQGGFRLPDSLPMPGRVV